MSVDVLIVKIGAGIGSKPSHFCMYRPISAHAERGEGGPLIGS